MKTQELQKPAFFIALSNIESRIGLHGKAIQYAKQATELAPESKEATLQLSKIYDRAGKKKKQLRPSKRLSTYLRHQSRICSTQWPL